MDPTATPLTTAEILALPHNPPDCVWTLTGAQLDEINGMLGKADQRIKELNGACLQAMGLTRAAEDRFVKARAENDELEQELADLRNELLREKELHMALRAAIITKPTIVSGPPGAVTPLNQGKEDDAPMAFAGIVFATVCLGLSFFLGWFLHGR